MRPAIVETYVRKVLPGMSITITPLSDDPIGMLGYTVVESYPLPI